MQAIIGLILRHALTGVGAVLVAKGADPTSVESIVGGVAAAAGLAWSWWQKKRSGAV